MAASRPIRIFRLIAAILFALIGCLAAGLYIVVDKMRVAAEPEPCSRQVQERDFVDLSIAGIGLFDANSTAAALGGPPEPDPSFSVVATTHRYFTYLNQAGLEQLTLVKLPRIDPFPGSHPYSIAEVWVKLAEGEGHYPPFPNSLGGFVTGKGIRLGMTRAQTLEILGPPTSADQDSIFYLLTGECPVLQRFEMKEYSAGYTFAGDELTSFSFGFDDPPKP